MAAITICSDFGAPQKNCFHCFPIYLPWSDGTRCHDLRFLNVWALSQLFHSPLSPSSRSFLVPLHFMPLGWYHLHIWGYWYISQQSWFQLELHPAWHFTWCTLRNKWNKSCKWNKQSVNVQPWCTPFPIWNQSIVPCLVFYLFKNFPSLWWST